MAHPHGAVISVCDCDISCPYSLTLGAKRIKIVRSRLSAVPMAFMELTTCGCKKVQYKW